jgi:hemoglobin
MAFYARVDRDPLLRPLFPGTTLTCAIEEFAAFLAQFLGGPAEDMQRRWWLSLRESHLRFRIGQRERDAWIANMSSALDDVQIEEPTRGRLLGFFERSSAHVMNQGDAVVSTQERGEAHAHLFGDNRRNRILLTDSTAYAQSALQLVFYVVYCDRERAIHPVLSRQVYPRPRNVAIRW